MAAPVTPTVIRKPLLSLQCDWDDVLREIDGSVWVSCKEIGSPGKYGKLIRFEAGDSNMCSVKGTDNFKASNVTPRSLTLHHQDPNCKCDFFAPSKVFSRLHLTCVCSLDISDAGLGVSVCNKNSIKIWDADDGTIRRYLDGHVWDVYSVRFFPSGIVVLSGSGDMTLKIWAAETGLCPVTMKGHTGAVVDTAIVERGRNIVSVSKDGTARLWNCGQGACLDIVSKDNETINCCAVAAVDIDVGLPDNTPSEKEVGTEGKLLLLGCENGSFKGVGLQSRRQIFEYKCDSAINCCCFVSSTTAAFGTHDGKICLFDLRARLPVTIWEESLSPVLRLIKVKNRLFSSRADGTCTFTSLDSDESLQLTGPLFESVYCLAFKRNVAYTGAGDGKIRKYELPL